MRANQARRLRELEDRKPERDLGPMVWMRHDQAPDEAREAAGLAPGAPCAFFKWRAIQ